MPSPVDIFLAYAFMATCLYNIVVGVLFDAWLAPRHLQRTGQLLLTPRAIVPLSTPILCGLILMGPARGRTRGSTTSIHLAHPVWQWLAKLTVPASVIFLLAGLGWYLLPATG